MTESHHYHKLQTMLDKDDTKFKKLSRHLKDGIKASPRASLRKKV